MPEVIKILDENLRQQVSLYVKLVELERRKQKALVENNLQELEKITAQEEQLLIEANRFEKERVLWAEDFGKKLSKAPEELTLAELVDAFPVLKEVQTELDHVIVQLQELHRMNTELLEQAVKVVNLTVGLITQEEKPTYNHPHKKAVKNSTINFLDKSI